MRAYTYFSGFLMGIADLIPGVSGGTMAFILGVYESFIQSISAFSSQHIKDFICFRWVKIWREVNGSFFITLVSGMASALLLLSSFFHGLLNDEVGRVYLFSAFLGLILASAIYVGSQVRSWNVKSILALIVGVILALIVVLVPESAQGAYIPSNGFDINLLLFGAMASSAMLLPGISGSYMLTIVGAYPVIIASLSTLTKGAMRGEIETYSLWVLMQLLFGIVFGAIVASRMIKLFLNRFYDVTIALLTGFMVGALPAIWPWWVTEKSLFAGSKLLIAKEMRLPSSESGEWLGPLLVMASAFLFVILWEKISLYYLKKRAI